jgi:hypothetical protein
MAVSAGEILVKHACGHWIDVDVSVDHWTVWMLQKNERLTLRNIAVHVKGLDERANHALESSGWTSAAVLVLGIP